MVTGWPTGQFSREPREDDFAIFFSETIATREPNFELKDAVKIITLPRMEISLQKAPFASSH